MLESDLRQSCGFPDMEHAGTTLENIVGDSLRRSPRERAAVAAWPVACGHAVAERTRAIDFAAGILRVEVPDGSWCAELKRLAPQYLAVLNRYVGGGIRRIEFILQTTTGGKGARSAPAANEGQ
jgi:predicted nucleic acid-binding Zn ribbon protein